MKKKTKFEYDDFPATTNFENVTIVSDFIVLPFLLNDQRLSAFSYVDTSIVRNSEKKQRKKSEEKS